MADISRSRRFFAKKRELYAAPVNRSLCCCAPVRIIIGGHGCEACKQPTRAVQVRDLGQVQGARLGDCCALGITQSEAVRAIREMVGHAKDMTTAESDTHPHETACSPSLVGKNNKL